MRKRVWLPLSAAICERREAVLWPKNLRRVSVWAIQRPHSCAGWRNAYARRVGYKAHRYCSAGCPLHDTDILRMAGLWPWQAVRMTWGDVLALIPEAKEPSP